MNNNPFAELARSWWVPVFYGVIAILFGIVAVFAPLLAAWSMVFAIGLLALVEGLVSLFALFDKSSTIFKGWLTFYAITSILFGIIAMLNPAAMATVMVIFLAAWLVIAGIYRIIVAIQIRKAIRGEWLIILSGVLILLLGILFAIWPDSGLIVMTVWVGVLVLICGVLQVMAGFRLRKLRA
ncbi:MAG: DUF308 domain-containing protein [Xanthomonadaceae bacterium]|jgi:uncharacterized membrane protein HdeD (DUF308 family)|nr:DUF308 domain-containing protein [Xanthomonadaceae bacterium]